MRAVTAGARIPHRFYDIAVFTLAGGDNTKTAASVTSVGWTVADYPGATAVQEFGFAASPVQHTWLGSERQTGYSSGEILYADALVMPDYAVRATVVSGALASGGTDTWLRISEGPRNWYVNTGGNPGEVYSATILLELKPVLDAEGTLGSTLAAGVYSMTAIRT